MSALSRTGEAFRPLPLRRKASLVVEILVTYVRARWWLRKQDLETTVEALRANGHAAPRCDERSAYVNGVRLGSAVMRTLALLPTDSRCLVRSVVLTALLARRGIPSSLVIGVRSGPDFAAHAWVEHAGTPLLPDEETMYPRLVEL
jgi:Transglutaminase-like superfamily